MLAQAERSLLAKLAFFLCRDGEVPEAEKIFSGLALSDPDKDGPVAGLALCGVVKGECEAAVSMLDARLARGSGIAPSLLLYKLLALGMAGQLGKARELRETMAGEGMAEAVKTADLLLEDLSKRPDVS